MLLVNTFKPLQNITSDLVISKTVEHPLGEGYAIPDNIAFDFEVNLGKDYAGSRLTTTNGEKREMPLHFCLSRMTETELGLHLALKLLHMMQLMPILTSLISVILFIFLSLTKWEVTLSVFPRL